ncbi:hypothetical protein L0Y40_02600 [Candidatus Wolfebacteria bacterium]|nr:hypothetical protein [Candidatus Wolfebacteria bacterium]
MKKFVPSPRMFAVALGLALAFAGAATALADIVILSATLNGGSFAGVPPSGTVEVELTVERGPNNAGSENDWESTFVDILDDGEPGQCVDTPDHDIGAGVDVESFDITAPGTPGSYDVLIGIYRGPDCDGSARDSVTLVDGLIVGGQMSVVKYNDVDGDGGADAYLGGWEMRLYDANWQLKSSKVTVASGVGALFFGVEAGDRVCEVMQAGWTQTAYSPQPLANGSPNAGEEGAVCISINGGNFNSPSIVTTMRFHNHQD